MKTLDRILVLLLTLLLCLPGAMADGEEETLDETALYIIADSDTRELTADELWGFSCETLGYIRNEILARHGYAFHNMKFYNYFNAKPWYKAGGYTDMNCLSNVERRNHSLVRQIENAMIADKNENLGGVDIADIIAAQNELGGYGNEKKLGNEYGNGDGKTYPEEEAEKKLKEKLENMAASAKPNYIYNTQYIIPDSDSRQLTEEELWAYSRETLRYIRNELLARHGYNFGDNKFGRYFKTKSWYSAGNDNDNLALSGLEWQNVNLVRKVEGYMDQLKTENTSGLDISTIISNQNANTCPGK